MFLFKVQIWNLGRLKKIYSLFDDNNKQEMKIKYAKVVKTKAHFLHFNRH